MKISIKNYRGIEAAEVELSPIALIAAHNGAGKTSIAQAVAAALTANAVPIDGVTKAAAGLLLRDGAKRGQCIVEIDAGSATVNWPGASIRTDGRPPHASPIACGLESIAEMKPKDAAAALQAALRAEPNREQLVVALTAAGVRDDLAVAVADRVDREGYDAGAKRASSRAAELKGGWEQITGERWGAAKAANWQAAGMPQGTCDLDDLRASAEAAAAVLEATIADQAADQSRVEELRQRATAALPSIEHADQLLAQAHADWKAKAASWEDLPRPKASEESVPCPHCKASVVIRGKALHIPADGLSDAENASREKAITQAKVEVDESRAVLSTRERERSQAIAADSAAKAAARELEGIKEGGTSAEDVEKARQGASRAKSALLAAEATKAATDQHRAITEMLAVAEVLAPTGVRQAALEQAIADLHIHMDAITNAAGWQTVGFGADMVVSYGGRPYRLVSASEQFRARVVLQLAIAERDGSDAVIVDAADILDKAGRNGLFRALLCFQTRALVTMTMNNRNDVPDLGQLGTSYWIEEARLENAAA